MTTPSPSTYPVGAFLPAGGSHNSNLNTPLPPNHPTTGFKLNHFMLRIRDPTPSLHFYIHLMGMRTVFVMNVGPFTIYYLGYPQTDAHRADSGRFGVETTAKLQETLGLLELYHVHGSEKKEKGWYETSNDPPNLGFGHLGFTVAGCPFCTGEITEGRCGGAEALGCGDEGVDSVK